MNRCFLLQELSDPSLINREQTRAKQLNELLGPKASGSWIQHLHRLSLHDSKKLLQR